MNDNIAAKAPKPNTREARPAAARELFDAKQQINSSHTSELVIALCGPIGSPLHKVAQEIKARLENDFAYEFCTIVRLSELIERFTKKAPEGPPYIRTRALIEQGDSLREKFGPSILAELAVNQIVVDRQKAKDKSGLERYVPQRVCHIIDSIKNQEELEILKLVYRDMLYFVGVYAPLPARVANIPLT
jgi:hypothetical protein